MRSRSARDAGTSVEGTTPLVRRTARGDCRWSTAGGEREDFWSGDGDAAGRGDRNGSGFQAEEEESGLIAAVAPLVDGGAVHFFFLGMTNAIGSTAGACTSLTGDLDVLSALVFVVAVGTGGEGVVLRFFVLC